MADLDERGRPILGKYTGPAYRFGPEVGSVLGPKSDVNVIMTSIYNILTTPKGSVEYAPDTLGSVIPSLLFETMDDVNLQMIHHFARDDLRQQEPRINVHDVLVARVEDRDVAVTIVFSIVGDADPRRYTTHITFLGRRAA